MHAAANCKGTGLRFCGYVGHASASGSDGGLKQQCGQRWRALEYSACGLPAAAAHGRTGRLAQIVHSAGRAGPGLRPAQMAGSKDSVDSRCFSSLRSAIQRANERGGAPPAMHAKNEIR